jgi:hypothetical protein
MQDCRRGIYCPFLHVSLQSRNPAAPVSPGLLPKSNYVFEREVYDRGMPNNQFFRGEGVRRQFEPYARPNKPANEMKPPIVKTDLCRDWARFNGDCPRGARFVSFLKLLLFY